MRLFYFIKKSGPACPGNTLRQAGLASSQRGDYTVLIRNGAAERRIPDERWNLHEFYGTCGTAVLSSEIQPPKGGAGKAGPDGKDNGDVDAAIVGTHLMMEAAELGLGSTWVGSFDPAAVIREFSLPANLVPVALFPMGYPAEDAGPSVRHTDRKPIGQTVWYERF